jgi:hypothetical protein
MMRRAVAASPRPTPPRKGLRLSAWLVALALLPAACRAVETSYRYPEDLRHPDYVKRSLAVAEFAELRDRAQLPDAFRLLLDENAQIRLVAYEAIRDLSPNGEDFGYRPYLPEDVRCGIVLRWQAWWTATTSAGEEVARE